MLDRTQRQDSHKRRTLQVLRAEHDGLSAPVMNRGGGPIRVMLCDVARQARRRAGDEGAMFLFA